VQREPSPMTHAKRIVQLHFPLERITEPVVTRLVTEYDLSPNILRANIDAKSGGWLVVELTGDAARADDALEWLRAQGLVVTDSP